LKTADWSPPLGPRAERDPEHSLAQQGHDLMLDQMLAPSVVKVCGKPLRQFYRMIRCPKKQRPRIRGDRPAVECRHHFAAFDRCKSEQIRATVCGHRGAPRITGKSFSQNNFR
jgi:hypothetical protein